MKHASLAQLPERRSSKPMVRGWSPLRSTTFIAVLLSCGLALSRPAAAEEQRTAKTSTKAVAKKGPAKSGAKAAKTPQKIFPGKVYKAKGRVAPAKRGVVREAAPVEAAPRAVILEKGPVPTRTELGCSNQSDELSAVGQVMKAEGKTFRCQKTWDYAEGKLVAYPAWVELFMPTPGWGAGLRETPPPPAEAVLPLIPNASSQVSALADTQASTPIPAAKPASKSDVIRNYLY